MLKAIIHQSREQFERENHNRVFHLLSSSSLPLKHHWCAVFLCLFPKRKLGDLSFSWHLFLRWGLLLVLQILQDYSGSIRHPGCLLCRIILVLPDIILAYPASLVLILQSLILVHFYAPCFRHCIITPSVSLPVKAIIYTLNLSCTARCC